MGKNSPLGILYLASSLLENGIEVHVIDLNALVRTHGIGLRESIDLIIKNKPHIIGISATSYQLRAAFQLAEILRGEFENDVTIGLGGPHVSVDPDFINRFPEFDFGLVGDGEITFPKLVKRLLEGQEVKGIFNGEQAKKLDDISFPARKFINKNLYDSEEIGCANILAIRGCSYNCIFCAIKGLGGRKVRFRSPGNVVDEMEEVNYEYNERRFWFVDDTFTINRNNTIQLCNELINRDLDVEWMCETRVDNVDKKLLKLMHRAGCIQISFGIESGSERIRRNVIRKNFTNDQAIRVFRSCKKIGISTGAYVMLGFPTETKEDIYRTVHFLEKLDPNTLGVHITQILPGSDLYTLALKEGRFQSDIYDQYARGKLNDRLPIYIPKGLSLSDLRIAREEAYKKFTRVIFRDGRYYTFVFDNIIQ